MNLREEFMQPARKAFAACAGELRGIHTAMLACQRPDGGFAFPGAKTSCTLQTAWALEALNALREDLPLREVREYLGNSDMGWETMGIAEFAGLVRCWSQYPKELEEGKRRWLAEMLSGFRTDKVFREYSDTAGRGVTIGAQFWGVSIAQELGLPIGEGSALMEVIERERDPLTGCYRDGDGEVSLLATSQAASLMRVLAQSGESQPVAELLQRLADDSGGFRESANALTPDVRSTAHGLHLAAAMRLSGVVRKELCLDYLEAMQVDGGAFCRDWSHGDPDAESTFHGLVALGHLA